MPSYTLMFYQPAAQTWKQVPLAGPSFSIGRSEENDLALDDTQVSRQHADLYIDERGIWILDKGSSNGIIFNGLRLPTGEWKLLPLAENFTIGATTLRVEAIPGTGFDTQTAGASPAGIAPRGQGAPQGAGPKASRRSRLPLPLLGLAIMAVCICLAGGGAAAWYLFPKLSSQSPLPVTLEAAPLSPNPAATQPAAGPSGPVDAPPQVIDDLPAAPGAGPVSDDRGVSLSVPAGGLEDGQQAYLERANLSPGMQAEIEQAYQVDSLAYAVRLKEGQDGAGRAELSLPAASPDSRLAVLVDGRYLGILETPAQDGAFHISAGLEAPEGGQSYQEPADPAKQAPNRYLVLTPKKGNSLAPGGSAKLASLAPKANPGGEPCVPEQRQKNLCWRNPEGSIYAFWENNDAPKSLQGTELQLIEDTIQAVAEIMNSYQQKGFSAAAISHSNPAYLVIEPGTDAPYYSFRTGNVYLPWDIISGLEDTTNRCDLAHEFFHWIEDENYIMGIASLSGSRSWWQEASAENGAFLISQDCIERNLTKYGVTNTSDGVLGFQAAPFAWEWNEEARYIQALGLYLGLCEGGPNCALSQADWVQAINSGSYPMSGSPAEAYMRNTKDLGRFLLGAPPQESRSEAVIPPSAISGNHYGDYLILKDFGKTPWDYGLTNSQFKQVGDKTVDITARIDQGGVYPLWVGNGTGTPLGGVSGHTGPPAMLEIQPGPAFWIKQGQNEPVFYPAESGLLLGPLSDKLGIGTARIVAIAPEAAGTFQARVSLADFSGDWSAELSNGSITPVDCPDYSPGDNDTLTSGPDKILQLFSGYGEYVSASPQSADLIWQGHLPDGVTGSSEVTVEPDQVSLHFLLDIPRDASSGGSSWIPGLKSAYGKRAAPDPAGGRTAWLAAFPALPILAGAAWLGRRRRKLAWLVLALALASGVLLLSGCVGVGIWGTFEGTYTFHQVEYVGPQPGAAASSSGSGAIWKLSNGSVKYDIDLTLLVSATDLDGNTSEEQSRCRLAATAAVLATVGPPDSVSPPDFNQ